MHLIDENFQPLITPVPGKSYSDTLYWEFQPQKKTYRNSNGHKYIKQPHFSLVKNERWVQTESEAYELSIGKNHLILPVNYYLLIGDFDAGLDFIRADEVLGRDFEAFTFTLNLEEDSWLLKDLSVVKHITHHSVIFPFTKKPVAVCLGSNIAVMVSSVDNYSKLSDLSFCDII